MTEPAELELALHRREGTSYTIEMRFIQPDSDADIRLGQGEALSAQFDFEDLRAKSLDAAAYGKALTASLFADPNMVTAFSEAMASAQSLQAPLRVRLVIGASAPELHTLYWETLRNPKDQSPLFTGEKIFFSRYLSSLDWRPVRLRSKAELKALVAVSNPSNLSEYELGEVKKDDEVARARQALGDIPVTVLPQAGQFCTLNSLTETLRAGCDILYLVAHGIFKRNEAWLLLEGEDGKIARVSGTDLVTRIQELQEPPRLIVLASCQSAGEGAGQALQALGPRLTEAGVPAVIAMQGNISMDTVGKFMPVLFQELRKDGSIDRAVAVARGLVREQSDYWIPVLFMRLKSGRIWYEPGFSEQGGFKKWPALLNSIKRGQCTPILGAGLYEPLIGTWREIASNLAEEYHYPLAKFYSQAFPQVAQYLAINQDTATILSEIDEAIWNSAQKRCEEPLPETLKSGIGAAQEILSFVGAKLRQKDPFEQHKVLASLPLPIYLTTNYDNLLADALKEADKDPQVVICPWNERFFAESIYDKEPGYRPTAKRPLVYHLFGQFSVPESMVLTEDHYFEYLIGITRNKDLIPSVVRNAMVNTALMFIGFQADDWSFRVLFRSVMGLQGGTSRQSLYSHVAVQLEPDDANNLDPKRARDYLKEYFDSASKISIYWGQSYDFLRELSQQWKPA